MFKLKAQIMNSINTSRSVSLCYKDTCIKAGGKNGEMLAAAAAITLVMLGIAAILKSA